MVKCRELYQGARCCKVKGHPEKEHQANNGVTWPDASLYSVFGQEIHPGCSKTYNPLPVDSTGNPPSDAFLESIDNDEQHLHRLGIETSYEPGV